VDYVVLSDIVCYNFFLGVNYNVTSKMENFNILSMVENEI